MTTMQKFIRALVIGALFLVPITPFIVADPFFFPFITGKAMYFRFLVEVAFFGWLILTFLDAKYRPKFSALTISVTVFMLVALAADLLGVNPLRSIWSNFERMEGWLMIVHLWAFYLAASGTFGTAGEGARLWHRWFNTSLVVALAIGAYGLGQYFGWFAIHQGSTRIDASLGNAAYMAVYLLIQIGFAAYLFCVARARRIANAGFLLWFYPIIAVFFAFLLYETATRGTILGLIGGTMLALLLYSIFGGVKSSVPSGYGSQPTARSRYISAGLFLAIVILGLLFWFNRDSAFVQRHETLRRMASISWQETQSQSRAYIWPMALKGAAERPVLGWGQENFNYIFNANYNPKMWAQEQWFDRAHNIYLDWLVAGGVLGLLAYLALYVFLLISVWRSPFTIAEKSILTGLVAGYAVHNVFIFDNISSYVFFFSLLAFASSVRPGTSWKLFGERPLRFDAVEYIVAPIVIILFVAAVYFSGVRPLQANKRLITALNACNSRPDAALFASALAVDSYQANQEIREQLYQCGTRVSRSQVPAPIQQAFLTLVAAQIQAQIKATPNDARSYMLGGTFLNDIGETSLSAPILERAHQLSPAKQTITFQLATAYINTGRKNDAVELLKKAYESAPDNTDARSAYVITLIAAGRESEARTLFKDASIFETLPIAQAYISAKEYLKAIAIYKKLLETDQSNAGLFVQLAQTQYTARMYYAAIETLNALGASHPELKSQVEAAIKEVQSAQAKGL